MARLPLLSKYCTFLRVGHFRIIKRISEAHPIDRILNKSFDNLRRLDTDNLVNGWCDVIDMVKLSPGRVIGFDTLRPGDDHRVARAAEVRGDQLRILKRRVSGPCPAGVVHAVGLGRAERVKTANLLKRSELLFDGVRDSILCQQFADRTVLAFRAGTVVAKDVDDNRVVA